MKWGINPIDSDRCRETRSVYFGGTVEEAIADLRAAAEGLDDVRVVVTTEYDSAVVEVSGVRLMDDEERAEAEKERRRQEQRERAEYERLRERFEKEDK